MNTGLHRSDQPQLPSSNCQLPRDTVTHRVKCWPEYFQQILKGSLPFQVRYDDRGYMPGHILELLEYEPSMAKDKQFTGRTHRVRIENVWWHFPNLLPGCVALSTVPVSEKPEKLKL